MLQNGQLQVLQNEHLQGQGFPPLMQAGPQNGHLQGHIFQGQGVHGPMQAMMQHGHALPVPVQAILQGQLPAIMQGQMTATMLIHQAARNADLIEHSRHVALCRAHQLFAGAAFCFRYSNLTCCCAETPKWS